jgi:hypothetical protein
VPVSTTPLDWPDGGACPALGSSCTTQSETCGTRTPANCGVIEVCDTHQPTMCPRSSSKYKDNVEYLDDARLAGLHDQTMRVRLATYNYKSTVDDPKPKHLGFIIEDNPQSPAVDRSGERVDMYGYLSMVVAAMQVQEKEIAALRRELEESRAACPTAASVCR